MTATALRYGTPVRWLEITPDYRCNNRCVGCFSVNDAGPSMTPTEVVRALERARAAGTTALWLGGGEPTLRRDLFAIVAAARARGFTTVKLQTNGMMLAYPAFAARCADAGITEVSFGIRGATAETHDRLARTPGCFDLMCAGIAQARAAGMRCEGDVLVYASNHVELPRVVDTFAPLGLGLLRVWVLSAAETTDPAV
ncbi:MAG: radical SAM protein, partial [Deltaproteobacteria bacterium]